MKERLLLEYGVGVYCSSTFFSDICSVSLSILVVVVVLQTDRETTETEAIVTERGETLERYKQNKFAQRNGTALTSIHESKD